MMTLGQLIDALPNNDEAVFFDFCGAFPRLLVWSYRGYYERAALDWSVLRKNRDRKLDEDKPPTAKALKEFLCSLIGTTMEGYKGGDYTIDRDTLMHVDGHGECNNTAIASVEVKSWITIIHTEVEE